MDSVTIDCVLDDGSAGEGGNGNVTIMGSSFRFGSRIKIGLFTVWTCLIYI